MVRIVITLEASGRRAEAWISSCFNLARPWLKGLKGAVHVLGLLGLRDGRSWHFQPRHDKPSLLRKCHQKQTLATQILCFVHLFSNFSTSYIFFSSNLLCFFPHTYTHAQHLWTQVCTGIKHPTQSCFTDSRLLIILTLLSVQGYTGDHLLEPGSLWEPIPHINTQFAPPKYQAFSTLHPPNRNTHPPHLQHSTRNFFFPSHFISRFAFLKTFNLHLRTSRH